jgi:hypothetical protein
VFDFRGLGQRSEEPADDVRAWLLGEAQNATVE